jgi:prevent-host-death family protein
MTRKARPRPRERGPALSLVMLKSRRIGAAVFKARCLQLMDEVQRSGLEIVITKHRKPVARLVPARPKTRGFCGSLAGYAIGEGDIVGPTGVEWEADESNLT